MEDLHLTAEDTNADEESRSKKTKKIGATAVEAKPSQVESRKKPEHIGQMLLNKEPEPAAKKAPERRPLPATSTHVETLSRSELLNLSDTIDVDGSTLRQIYETHLIGEQGLRRLVSEHLRGGDLKKALRNEVTEREIDFERDPVVRDMRPSQTAPASTDASKTALDKLLKKAGTSVVDGTEETAFFKARARYEANELAQHKQQRRMVDITMAAVVTFLLALIIFLYLSRK